MSVRPASEPLPRVLGLTPFERPDVRCARALARAGALACLDLGRDAQRAGELLLTWKPRGGAYAVLLRNPELMGRLPAQVSHVVVPPAGPLPTELGGSGRLAPA